MGSPAEFATWHEYIISLSHLKGFDALPVFHGVDALLGPTGMTLLAATVLAGISTGINGLYRGCSFLLQSMAKDDLLPKMFAGQAEDGTPRKAVFLILLFSLPIPFLGRTAIVWLVDAITISGSIAYAYVSLCRYREAKAEQDSPGKFLGMTGLVLSLFFFFCPIVPDLLLGSTLDTESYLLLAVWSVLGLVYYWYVFKHDEQNRFGKSFSLCTVLLFLNFFATALWLRQATVAKIPLAQMGGYAPVHEALNQNSTIQLLLIMLILLFMADIFTTMRRREHEMSNAVLAEQRASRTRGAYLTNMTHDIGLMMSATMSYVTLARKTGQECSEQSGNCPPDSLDGLWQGLKHTDSISHYFLHLVQEMEQVDHSTKLELFPVPTDIRYNMQQVQDIFITQMQEKNINFMVYSGQLENPFVLCDKNRLQRILLNLISLAYDHTPIGGSIAVTLAQKGFAYHKPSAEGEKRSFHLYADYELRIKDSGGGVPQHVVDNFLQNCDWHELFKTAGPERGLAIVRHLVDLFHGSIDIVTSPEQGTEIVIELTLQLAKQSTVPIQFEPDAMNMV